MTIGPRAAPLVGFSGWALLPGLGAPHGVEAWVCTWGCVRVSLALRGSRRLCDSLLEAVLGILGPR